MPHSSVTGTYLASFVSDANVRNHRCSDSAVNLLYSSNAEWPAHNVLIDIGANVSAKMKHSTYALTSKVSNAVFVNWMTLGHEEAVNLSFLQLFSDLRNQFRLEP